MTKREAAIVSAYTGFLLGDFDEMVKYIEEISGRPIFTHEISDVVDIPDIKNRINEDFVKIEIK